MSSIQDVSAEQLAKVFHHYREALGRDRDSHGVKEDVSPWERTPQSDRRLMVAAARLALLELAALARPARRKYYAKPGEAEWGC